MPGQSGAPPARGRSSRRRAPGGRAARSAAGTLRVALLDPDPYLGFLLERHFPDLDVARPAAGTDPASLLAAHPDLVVLRSDDPLLAQALADHRVVVVAERRSRWRPLRFPGAAGVLLRPFASAEVKHVVGGALGLRREEERRSAAATPARRARVWLDVLRFASVAVAAVLQVSSAGTAVNALLLAVALAYVAGRTAWRQEPRWLAWADVGVASVLVGLSGGVASAYTGFALTAAVSAGLALGRPAAVVAGLLIGAGAAPALAAELSAGYVILPSQLGAWFVLFPLAAFAADLATRMWHFKEGEGEQLLAEANRVLARLHDIARTMPGAFDMASVAAAVFDEIRDTADAPAGVLLLEEVGLLSAAGSFGIPSGAVPVIDRDDLTVILDADPRVVEADELPQRLGAALAPHRRWFAGPLRHAGAPVGLLLVAWEGTARAGREDLARLEGLTRETSLAILNARLFARIRELSVDEERRRLAAELHDGVAQLLTHVRLELDFIAMQAVRESVRDQAHRLAKVVERGQQEVRSTIGGLRFAVSAEGLAASLQEYVRDIRSLGGPTIRLHASADSRLPADVEAEVFRVAQEAISNAVRHAGARTIDVSVEINDGCLRLAVEDDGAGLRPADPDPRAGLGLKAMRERASRIGGQLDIGEGLRGGTLVELVVDPRRPTVPTRRSKEKVS